jgi:hypothetical protein
MQEIKLIENKRFDLLAQKLKEELGLLLSISFGLFAFILFFQPFTPINFNFNNYLVFVAGLGGIEFLVIVLIRTVLTWLMPIHGNGNDNGMSNKKNNSSLYKWIFNHDSGYDGV